MTLYAWLYCYGEGTALPKRHCVLADQGSEATHTHIIHIPTGNACLAAFNSNISLRKLIEISSVRRAGGDGLTSTCHVHTAPYITTGILVKGFQK